MKTIRLPTIPNTPVKKNAKKKEGFFCLKKFGSFDFVHNIKFNHSDIKYNKNYQNDQSNSKIFRSHLDYVYSIIKSKFPKGAKLVEVGCGKGSFLDIVKKDNHFKYSGYDETYEGNDKNIYKRYLVEKDKIQADIVILRHTLEHIKSPYNFLKLLKNIFSNKAIIYIEVPQFNWIVRNKVLFDFTYEHVNYFNTKSLCSLFSKIIERGNLFGGQYQYCLAKLDLLALNNDWAQFHKINKHKKFDFKKYHDHFFKNIKYLSDKKNIWIWGGATKGVIFLKHLSGISPKIFKKIKGVIDINEKKHSYFTPSTYIPILSPKQFCNKAIKTDFVLVMNPNYLSEIKTFLKDNLDFNIEIRAFK